MPPPPSSRAIARARAIAAVAGIVAVVGIGAIAATVAVTPGAVALAPVTLDAAAGVASGAELAARLHASAFSLRERAQAGDDLRHERDADWVRLELEASGVLAAAKRTLHRSIAGERPRILPQISTTAEHLEIVLREEPGHASVRSRVPRGPAALERVLAEGAHDLLLIAWPLAAASLVAQDSRLYADVVRLDELAAVLHRNAHVAGDPRALIAFALHDAAHGRCRQAIARFDRVIVARPAAPRAYVLAADCHARIGERDRARERLAQIERHGEGTPLALALAGEAYLRLGDAEHALALLRAAHARDAESPVTAIAIGEALLALRRPAEAMSWLSAHPPADELRIRWLAAVGAAQVRSGAGPAAQSTATALRALDPANVEATRIEAELAAGMKAWPQALGRFGALRLLAPDDGGARAGEGYALIELRRYADAIAAFRSCAQTLPWYAECWLGLGTALREGDQAEAALEALAQAASLDRLDPRIPAETARTLRALLRRGEAAVHAARAETLGRRLEQRLALP